MKIYKIILSVFIAVVILSSCSAATRTNSTYGSNSYESESSFYFESEKTGLNFYRAQEQGGFFIKKSDESYLPLCEEMVPINGEEDNIFMIAGENVDIPSLEKDDKLVCFSSRSLDDKYYFLPVLNEGYTVPFYFFESFDLHESNYKFYFRNYGFRDYEGNTFTNYNDYQIVDLFSQLGLYLNKTYKISFDNANGMSAEEFCKTQNIDLEDYCSDVSTSGCLSHTVLPMENYNDSVSVDFYIGTQYFEETFYADIKYYIIDGCQKIDLSNNKTWGERYYSGTAIVPKYTKEGYAVFDTSSLANGKYVIANLNDRVIFEINK